MNLNLQMYMPKKKVRQCEDCGIEISKSSKGRCRHCQLRLNWKNGNKNKQNI